MEGRQRIRKCFLCAGIVVYMGIAGTDTFVWASSLNHIGQEKAEAQKKQEQAEKKAQELEKQKQKTETEIRRLGTELEDLLIETDILDADMKDMKVRIKEAEQVYQAAEARRQQRYRILKERIRFIYEEGNITYLDILLKAKSMGDVVSQTEYFQQLYEYDQNLMLEYEKLRQEALQRKTTLEEHKSEMELMKKEYGLRQEKLQSTIDVRKKETESFTTQLKLAKEEAVKAADIVRLKTDQIRSLQAAEQRAKAAARENLPEDGGTVRTPVKSTGGTEFGRKVADYALQFVGNPYVWGGTSLTNGADCSGFTQSVYKHFGVSIPRTSGEQAHFGKRIAYKDMQPGDLVCYVGHVSMYIGDGRIVHAASQKSGIKVGDDPAYRTIVSIRRPWH